MKFQGHEALLIQIIRPYIQPSPRTLEPHEDEHLHPPRRMRALLEMIAPQVHECDHATTAQILHTGSQESLAVELVRLLIYLQTNNMVDKIKEITGCNINLQESADMMGFLRRLGLLTKTNVNNLARSADPTSQVFLERLLHHSIADEESFDVLGWLVPSHFDINHFVRINRYVGARSLWIHRDSRTLLQASSLSGNIQAVGLLLDLGADPYDNVGQSGTWPLEYAAGLWDHDRATAIADLLLSKQALGSSESVEGAFNGALEAAITRANNKLIVRLLSERQRLEHGTIGSNHFANAAQNGDVDTIRLLAGHALRTGNGTIELPKDSLFLALSQSKSYSSLNSVCDKLNYLLGLGAESNVSVCCDECGEAFILENLVGKVWMDPTQDSQLELEEDWILRVAQILREHGCPPDRPKSISGRSHAAEPSSLQLAIARGYPRVVAYLLDWGAEIDYYYQGHHFPGTTNCLHYIDPIAASQATARSPLLTALKSEQTQTEIAKMLLRRKPNLRLRGGERTLAMRSDDTELVTMLLQMRPFDKDECENLLEHALSWRSRRSIELLMSMEMRGQAAFAPATILRAALIIHDHEKIHQQLEVCDYDPQALCEAVVQSNGSTDYHKIVERILKTRQPAPNNRFEICAVAFAAIDQDMYLTGVLIESFRQGPWITSFPPHRKDNGKRLPLWKINWQNPSTHILNHVARDRADDGTPVFKTLLNFDIPAKGMHLDIRDDFTAETLKELIAAGADQGLQGLLLQAVGENKLAHVEVLCEAKVPLNMMRTFMPRYGPGTVSRTAVQVAVESGSPEMLQLLLQYGADVKQPAGYIRGATCLQLAAGAGSIGLVRFLLDKGAQVNAKRSLFDGRTAIELAAEHGRLDVLKLLLLQDEHLFQTIPERYQFIRAARFAEKDGHGVIVEMLRQHISWESDDQRQFHEIQGERDTTHSMVFQLDEITQKPLESEICDPEFLDTLKHEAGYARLKNIDIEGIEKWIGERVEEESDGSYRRWSGCSSAAEGGIPAKDAQAITQDQETPERTWPAGKARIQAEHPSGKSLPSGLMPPHDGIHDASANPVDLHLDQVTRQPAMQGHACLPISESLKAVQAVAPQDISHHPQDPMWLEMQDDDMDEMMRDLSGGLATQSSSSAWEALAHRPAARKLSRKHGMVLGEVLDGAPDIDDMGDDAVDHNGVENTVADRSHVQHFNWGIWDDESFAFHLEAYQYQ